MAKKTAYLNTNDGDLMLKNGGLQKGNCLAQETGDVLVLNKGQLKSAPLIGPDLVRFTKGKTSKMGKQVRIALNRDRKKVGAVVIKNGHIYPEVDY